MLSPLLSESKDNKCCSNISPLVTCSVSDRKEMSHSTVFH